MMKLTAPGWLLAFGLLNAFPAGLRLLRTRRASRSGRKTTPPTAPRRRSSSCSVPAPAARRSADRSPRSPPTSARSTTTPPAWPCWSGPGVMLGTYDYVANTRYSWGGVAFPFSGGSPDHRLPARHLRVQGPAGLHRGAAGRHRRHVLGQPDLRRRAPSPRTSPTGSRRASPPKYVNDRLGTVSGSAFAVDFGTNFHAVAQQSPGQVLVRARQPGLEPDLHGHRPRRRRAARPDPGRGPDVPTLPQQADLLDQGLPAPDDVPGRAWPTTSSPARTTGSPCSATSTSPTTTSPASPSAASGPPTSSAARTSASPSAGATATPAPTTSIPTTLARPRLNDEENLQGLAFGGGLHYGGSERVLASAWTTPTSIWAFLARPTSSASRWGGRRAVRAALRGPAVSV